MSIAALSTAATASVVAVTADFMNIAAVCACVASAPPSAAAALA